jgi:type IV pilus assembly protein PilE
MRGFTLVEVTVALALAALLAGTALPAYRGHVQPAGRLGAVDALTPLQPAQDRHRAAQGGHANGVEALDRARACDPEGRRPRGARC